MRLKAWVCSALAVGVLGSWQWENLAIIRREYEFAAYYDNSPSLEVQTAARDPARARIDPEAAAVAEAVYCEGDPQLQMDMLARHAMKYPQNQFFLYRLVETVRMYDGGLSPDLSILLANRLTALQPDNALYHYLNADVMLKSRLGDDVQELLREMEQANQMGDFLYPYDIYQEQVVRWAQQAALSSDPQHALAYRFGYSRWCSSLTTHLVALLRRELTDGRGKQAARISDMTHDMLVRQFGRGDRLLIIIKNMSGSGDFFPQYVELQHAALSREEARRKRWELCALWDAGPETTTSLPVSNKQSGWLAGFAATFGFMHLARMIIMFGVVGLALLILCFVRKTDWRAQVKIRYVAWLVIGQICYLGMVYWVILWHILRDPFQCGCIRISYGDAMHIFANAETLLPKTGLETLVFLILPLALALAIRLGRNRFHGRIWQRIANNRLLFLILLNTALGYLAFVFVRYPYIRFLVPTVFVVMALLTVMGERHGTLLRTLTGLLRVDDRGATRRGQSLQLIVLWFVCSVILLLLWSPGVSWAINTTVQSWVPPIQTYLCPAADQATYRQAVDRYNREDLTKHLAVSMMPLLMPDDLDVVIAELQRREFGADGPHPSLANGQPATRMGLEDELLVWGMSVCGRDTVEVITRHLQDPNTGKAMVARAKLGDHSVREELLSYWSMWRQGKAAEQVPAPASGRVVADRIGRGIAEPDILGALACLSEPEEAGERFLAYVKEKSAADLANDYRFFNNLKYLPSHQLRGILYTYMEKVAQAVTPENGSTSPRAQDILTGTTDGRPRTVRIGLLLRPLRKLLGVYGDAILARMVLEHILTVEGVFGLEYYLEAISPHLDHSAIGLLEGALTGANEQLRAWSMGQLTRLGYQWPAEVLTKLRKDANWQVRVNAVLAGGVENVAWSRDDPHGLVRLAGMLIEDGHEQ